MATADHAPKTTCDLCSITINTREPWPQMWYPFAATEQEKLAQAIIERYPSPFGNVIGIVRALPPVKYHKFDFCQGCVDGFMPMLEELRRIAFNAQLERLSGQVKDQMGEEKRPYE